MVNICDCCYEQSMCISTCKHGHKLCRVCYLKSKKKECLFCSPYGAENKNMITTIDQDKVIICCYLTFLLFISFYIEGIIYVFLDFLLNLLFVDNNLIFYLSWYFPNIYNFIMNVMINLIIILSFTNYFLGINPISINSLILFFAS